jgi:predicted nucleotidyltransferase
MNCLLTKEQIEHFQRLHVSLVYLFGSLAEGKNQPLSDVDIGVVFFSKFIHRENFNKVYNELYDIFTNVYPEESIDIVFLQKAGLELCFDAITNGQILYEFSKDERFQFEEKINIFFADFNPLLREFDKAIMNRI